jgi:hypothetical protein
MQAGESTTQKAMVDAEAERMIISVAMTYETLALRMAFR